MNKVGILVKNEDPADDEANDALDSLNAMISSWSNDAANIYARTLETFSLTTATSYTIGPGQTFNTIRPLQIIDAYVTLSGFDYTVDVITDEQYDDITIKTLNSGTPRWLNYNNGYPTAIIKLYPAPSTAYTLTLRTEKAVNGFATLDTQLSLPDGWERALIYNLAIELAAEYGQKPDGVIVEIANLALGAIKEAVVRVRTMNAYPENSYTKIIYDGWLN